MTPSPAATRSPKQRIVPNWSLFEQVFVSTFNYTNPLQEVTLTAAFTSPEGETRMVDGFWDGGRIWRVRFCPDTPGQWTFSTMCSDRKNDGLGGQSGKFLCTAPIGESPFQRHGPIRVARDRRHFEHADGTPFFWLADTVWNGARVSSPRDWQRYSAIRASQAFNVALWSVAPGDDEDYESALNGFPDRIGINAAFFQRLDAKLETLSRDGILSAILPLADLGAGDNSGALPAEQAALFYKYLLARWGSEPVAWLIRPRTQSGAKESETMAAVAQAVLTNSVHAPVILFGFEQFAGLAAANQLSWVDAYGAVADYGPSNQSAGASAPTKQISNPPPTQCPVIVFAPAENSVDPHSHARLGPDQIRREIYENLLTHAAAGVSYAGQGVADWDKEIIGSNSADIGRDLPAWEKALFMPGAKQMQPLAILMKSIEFWRFRPRPDAVACGSKSVAAQDCAVAASTDARDLMLVYLPHGDPVEMNVRAMPTTPNATWFDPRNGSTHSAAANVTGSTCQFPPPAEGDWVLEVKSGK
jgi:hypothetical protein